MFSSQFWDIWDIWDDDDDDDDDDPLSVCWEGVKTTIAPYSPPLECTRMRGHLGRAAPCEWAAHHRGGCQCP